MRASHRGGVALGVAVALLAPSTAAATTTSTTFTTPGENVFVVPPGISSLQMTLVGGNGGTGNDGAPGGVGATEIATLTVTPGQTLYAEVGGNGGNGDLTGLGLGGVNGGGSGGEIAFIAAAPSGGGGGGASDVRTVRACPIGTQVCASSAASLGSRLVVAAGGGGGGGGGAGGSYAGGNGGAADANGTDGSYDPPIYHDAIGTGGARGTPAGGGMHGTGVSGNAVAGALGIGGDGGDRDLGGGGGGGGGGIYGGGGGGDGTGQLVGTYPNQYIVSSGGGGGGGGASSIPTVAPPSVSNLSLIPTATGAQPQITFTWTIPPPTAVIATPYGITAHGATLAGTVNPNAAPVTGCYFTISPAPPGGPTISCAQQLQPVGTPVSVSAQLAGLNPSTRYTVQLVASNAQGTSTGGPVSFTTWPPPPTITALKVAKTIHRGSARHPKQAAFAFRLSQPSQVLVQFARLKGRRWVSLNYVLAPLLPAGARTVRFSTGRLGLGHYRMHVSAINGYGESSAVVQGAAFAIVK